MNHQRHQTTILFRRKIDGHSYRFLPCETRGSYPVWKRQDADVWIAFAKGHGWACVDAAGVLLAIPWGISLAAMPQFPPEGDWVSKKANASYVYELLYS
jgi:hypothetical protein